MKKKLSNVKLGLDDILEEKLKVLEPTLSDFKVIKKSLDARGKKAPHFVYTLDIYTDGDKAPEIKFPIDPLNSEKKPSAPLIIGSGPAGLFAALRLVERGIPCTLLEQGTETKQRLKDIASYWRKGELNPVNNVCHGEGGAGLFSDGKLITRIKSPHIGYVMNRLVQFGAPPEIEYLSNPHVGSDKIRRVIPIMREYLKENGCKIIFNTKVTELLFEQSKVIGAKDQNGENHLSEHVILACGHSANDLFYKLHEQGVFIENKDFAIGLRVEHPQEQVNKIQYNEYADHPSLDTANYKLTYNNNNVGVYSFCMCPGGYVLSSSTEPGTVVCNGMSNYKRNSPFANSAIVVTFKTPSEELFSGLKYRTQLEQKTYSLLEQAGGSRELPTQYLTDFLNNKKSSELDKTSSLSGAIPTNLTPLFPSHVYNELKNAFHSFDTKMKGFISDKAKVFAIESRTSCPIRMTRDNHSLESISSPGLYPCGEGAGYAGGITSAACDGINVAEKIYELYK